MANKNPQFNLRLDPELKAWLDAKARETRLSRTWLVNDLIREAKRNEAKSSAA
jgi:predicted transcriptional regulator